MLDRLCLVFEVPHIFEEGIQRSSLEKKISRGKDAWARRKNMAHGRVASPEDRQRPYRTISSKRYV